MRKGIVPAALQGIATCIKYLEDIAIYNTFETLPGIQTTFGLEDIAIQNTFKTLPATQITLGLEDIAIQNTFKTLPGTQITLGSSSTSGCELFPEPPAPPSMASCSKRLRCCCCMMAGGGGVVVATSGARIQSPDRLTMMVISLRCFTPGGICKRTTLLSSTRPLSKVVGKIDEVSMRKGKLCVVLKAPSCTDSVVPLSWEV
jgi:hypothetical protein